MKDSEALRRNHHLGISWESDSEALLQAVRLKLGWFCALAKRDLGIV
jgi:hypothetical protein